MNIRLIAFTDRGFLLAQRLAEVLPGEAERCGQPHSLQSWTEAAFPNAQALIFVGAAGIAVRAIAPYVKSKVQDPAVVVVDEKGQFAIPILSGHLGGANDLARKIAGLIGACPVITTATDVNRVFAVDEWAKRQNCHVANPEGIKLVSGKLLSGKEVTIRCPWKIQGTPPEPVQPGEEMPDVNVDIYKTSQDGLCLVPRIAVLGVGCKKDTTCEALERAYQRLLEKYGLFSQAVCRICSIDLKKEEPGLLAFAQTHGWQLETYSAQELAAVPGAFSASGFVKSVTGVDNVCERSALLGSGGTLIIKKNAGDGITMAVAVEPYAPDWSYNE